VAIFAVPIYPAKYSRFTIDNRFGLIYYLLSSSKAKNNKMKVSDMKRNLKGREKMSHKEAYGANFIQYFKK